MLTFDRNTQITRLLLCILIHFRPTSSSKKDGKFCLFLSICIRRHFSNECSDSVCVKNIEGANFHLLVITEFDAIGEYNSGVVILL